MIAAGERSAMKLFIASMSEGLRPRRLAMRPQTKLIVVASALTLHVLLVVAHWPSWRVNHNAATPRSWMSLRLMSEEALKAVEHTEPEARAATRAAE